MTLKTHLIDGEVVDELILSESDLTKQSATLTAADGEFRSETGADLDIYIKIVNSETGDEKISDLWAQDFG